MWPDGADSRAVTGKASAFQPFANMEDKMLTQKDRKFTAIMAFVLGVALLIWGIHVQYAAGIMGGALLLLLAAIAASSYMSGRGK